MSTPDVRELSALEAMIILRYRLSGRAANAIREHWGSWSLRRFKNALSAVPDEYRTKYLDELRTLIKTDDVHHIIYAKGVGTKTVHELKQVFTVPVSKSQS